jgi:hypothetical protein
MTGVGAPVTKRGFHEFGGVVNGLPIRLFDTKGLELQAIDEWLGDLNAELIRRNAASPVEEWFHSVFYCINSADTRVEEFDLRTLEAFRGQKQSVVVVLTKADLVSEDVARVLRGVIQERLGSELPVVEVCSVATRTRTGTSVVFGMDDVYKEIVRAFWRSICERLPDQVIAGVQTHIDAQFDNWVNRANGLLPGSDLERLMRSLQGIESELNTYRDELPVILRDVILQRIDHVVGVYGDFKDRLRLPDLSEFPPLGRRIPTPVVTRWKAFILRWATDTGGGILRWIVKRFIWAFPQAAQAEITVCVKLLRDNRAKFIEDVKANRAQIDKSIRNLVEAWKDESGK